MEENWNLKLLTRFIYCLIKMKIVLYYLTKKEDLKMPVLSVNPIKKLRKHDNPETNNMFQNIKNLSTKTKPTHVAETIIEPPY